MQPKSTISNTKQQTVKIPDSERIKYCGCRATNKGLTNGAEYQDSVYGKGRRVHTWREKALKFVCTICGRETGRG